ncbi:MAG: Maf family protein [Marinobacter sp.]|uniref:Maf family protein n=1 Tax=Marinobacter sp. TaxID=50741 RepID=UPI00299E7E77|nr:Maf family protein [Marinobacter sp.]MDX1633405.1 Maf family protein [Marinobacter sp.]
MTVKPLVLASSSPYRRALLARLGLAFECASPDVDEQPRPGEPAAELAERLARNKARALQKAFPAHWIIGSDQVATLPDGTFLSKPGDHGNARRQLARSSGETVTFHTGLALLDSASGRISSLCEPYRVHFRTLSDRDIEHYLLAETPYDCAGSFKMEGLGISLFRALEGRDPNTLVGLPLMALIDLLQENGLDLLAVAYRNSSRD